MGISYKSIPVMFNGHKFARDVTREVQALQEAGMSLEQIAIGELGVSVATLKNYMAANFAMKSPYPSMTNFIETCNILGLNPSNYFHLAY